MTITLLQTAIRPHHPEQACEAALRLIDEAPHSDLYLLPEMWATGFLTRPTEATARAATQASRLMQRVATERQCAVAGSVAIPPDESEAHGATTPDAAAAGGWRNRFFFYLPDGTAPYYDKQHLFAYGGEDLSFSPGEGPRDVEYKGLRFRLQTCFDLRFPETARNHSRQPYDVLLYTAGWPASRRSVWDILLQARAIENQAFCIGVNSTQLPPTATASQAAVTAGAENATSSQAAATTGAREATERPAPQVVYDGGSAVVDPYGRLIARLDAAEQAYTFSPDIDRMTHLRHKFPVLQP